MAGLPTLERKPGGPDNWVERTGGLPKYIDRIARQLHYKRGMTISHAIATAVNTVKRWARRGGVVKYGDPNKKIVRTITQAQAAAAVAQWEAKKAAARAGRGAKLSEGTMTDYRALAARANQIEDPERKAKARQQVLDLAVSAMTSDDKSAIDAITKSAKQTLSTVGPLLGKVSDQRVLRSMASQVQQASDVLSQVRWWTPGSPMDYTDDEREYIDLAEQIVDEDLIDLALPPAFLANAKKKGAGGATKNPSKGGPPPAIRAKMAGRGTAMPDGSFPINDVKDLKNAIRAIGRAKNPAAAKAHIKRRARALGATNLTVNLADDDDQESSPSTLR